MFWIFIVTYILNITDLLFTIHWVDVYGITAEANPIGKILINNGLLEIVKAFVGVLIIFIFIQAQIEENKVARIGLYICVVVYAIICIMHCLLWIRIKTI